MEQAPIYAANGRPAFVQDRQETTTLTYEIGNDRVISVTDPGTGTMSFTYGMAGERLTVSLPGGGTWTYTYDTSQWKVMPKDDPNSVSRMLWRVTDDQGRVVEYTMGHLGALREVRSNQTFSGGSLVSYQTARYTYDSDAANGRMWLTRLKNTWHLEGGRLANGEWRMAGRSGEANSDGSRNGSATRLRPGVRLSRPSDLAAGQGPGEGSVHAHGLVSRG